MAKKKATKQPSQKIAPDKAREMLEHPPHDKPLTRPQEKMLHAAKSKKK